MGKNFLLLVDAHSKWLEVLEMSATTSQSTIQKLRTKFATHGLPEILATDSGTAFLSKEFEAFMNVNGIRHIQMAPYHLASNGLAERAVQTFKVAMKKSPDIPFPPASLGSCSVLTHTSNHHRPTTSRDVVKEKI